MSAEPPSSAFPASAPAREARVLLREALSLLQRDPANGALDSAVDDTAAASSALYEVETSASTVQASNAGIHIAVERLSAALGALQKLEMASQLRHAATEIIARTLALLYPIARASLRQRRDVVVRTASSPPLAHIPPAPPPAGRPRKSTPSLGSSEKRSSGERIFVEVDIGLLSDSVFYTGLSQDLSRGGVFVATYQPQAPGARVALYFVLPNGHEVRAEGIVRWTREASDDAPPGMGVAFHELRDEDLRAIAGFCRSRAPMYHDSADD
jgi:uncharacterized protein (TIGR02266 family)